MNKKGFFIVLISLSVFLTAVFMLGANNSNSLRVNYSNELLEAKILLSNYEILLNQFALDCNWDNVTCIDSNSDKIIDEVFTKNLICDKPNFELSGDTGEREAIAIINCKEIITTDKNEFYLDLSKDIILKEN